MDAYTIVGELHPKHQTFSIKLIPQANVNVFFFFFFFFLVRLTDVIRHLIRKHLIQHTAITFYAFKTHTCIVTFSQSYKIWGYFSIFNTTLMGTIFLMKKKKTFYSFTSIASCWKCVNHAIQYIHHPITQKSKGSHLLYVE